MKYCAVRLGGAYVGLAVARLAFGLSFGVGGWLWCGALLCLLYVFLRPVMRLVALPFDLFLLGLAGFLLDALLVRWAAAWTPGLALSYPQALAVAFVMGLCFWPYEQMRRHRLTAQCRGNA